jgi:hypothetical protein
MTLNYFQTCSFLIKGSFKIQKWTKFCQSKGTTKSGSEKDKISEDKEKQIQIKPEDI